MKGFLNRQTLKWKVFAYLLGFCAILLVILWLFQTVLLDSFYRGIKVIEIKNNAKILMNNINSDNLKDLIASISETGDVSIDIITEEGIEIITSDDSKNGKFNKMPLDDKLKFAAAAIASNGEYVSYSSEFPTAHNDASGSFPNNTRPGSSPPVQSIVYVKIVKTDAGAAAILMNAQISPVNATVTTLRYQLYLVTAIMVLLAVILALVIARRVSKPIEEINKSAKLLASGSYDISFDGKGFREIGELSDTLNTAASELSKAEALRRELMANISHDLRTPLALIYSYAEVMHDFPDEISTMQTEIIMDEVQRLSTLVNDVLDISKLESGTQELSVTEFNLTKSLDATTNRIAELIKKDGYTLNFFYDSEVVVRADETKITQLFYNLLINAINYTGRDKNIAVRQVLNALTVRIEVTDTGEGIAPDDLAHIWDRYYKGDKKHKRALTGTGLGLSIVKKVVDLHGGECGVVSEPGKGSTFWFSLKR